jgi:hypothetical protein
VKPARLPLAVRDKALRTGSDWLGSTRTNAVAWWLPKAAILAGVLMSVAARTAIWLIALILDGNSVHFECTAVRTHTLSVYGAVLPGNDHSGARAWIRYDFG